MKLRLGPLPRSETVRMTITLSAALKSKLDRYASVHSSAWHEAVDAAALIPHMLEQFIDRDRGFKAASKNRAQISPGGTSEGRRGPPADDCQVE